MQEAEEKEAYRGVGPEKEVELARLDRCHGSCGLGCCRVSDLHHCNIDGRGDTPNEDAYEQQETSSGTSKQLEREPEVERQPPLAHCVPPF